MLSKDEMSKARKSLSKIVRHFRATGTLVSESRIAENGTGILVTHTREKTVSGFMTIDGFQLVPTEMVHITTYIVSLLK